MRLESERELLQKSYIILEKVVIYTEELAKTEGELNTDTAMMLLKTLVPDDPLNGSKDSVTFGMIQVLQPRERLAVMFAYHFCKKFDKILNSNNKQLPQNLTDEQVKNLFVDLSRTVQGILNPQGPFARKVLSSMTKTIDAYLNLNPSLFKDQSL